MTVTALDTSSTDPDPDGTGAVLWLELAEGTTRERLIERLAQAHLTVYGDGDLRGQGPIEEP
jgi:hypothetical protein